MKQEREGPGRFGLKKILLGAGLAGGDLAITQALGVLGGTESLIFGLGNSAIVDNKFAVLLASMALGLGVSSLVSIQYLRLNHKFRISPHGVGTLLFNAIDKKWPEHSKIRDGVVGVTQVVMTKDWILVPAALVNDKILGAYITAKGIITGYNLIKLVLSEIALRKIKKGQRKKEEQEKEVTIFDNQTIAEPREIAFASTQVEEMEAK